MPTLRWHELRMVSPKLFRRGKDELADALGRFDDADAEEVQGQLGFAGRDERVLGPGLRDEAEEFHRPAGKDVSCRINPGGQIEHWPAAVAREDVRVDE